MKKISILLATMLFGISFGQDSAKSLFNSSSEGSLTEFKSGNEDCSQEFTGEFSLANSISSDFGYAVANDFIVPAGSSFNFETITFLVVPLANAEDFIDFNVSFYTDGGGIGPDAELGTVEYITPTSVELYPETFAGYNAYLITLDLPEGFLIENDGASDGFYWVGITGPSLTSQNIFWIGSDYLDTTTSSNYQYDLSTGAWTQITYDGVGDYYESIFTIAGTCELLGVSDSFASTYSVYPNPVKDKLNINLENAEVKSLTVTNLSGQIVATSKTTSVNVSALPTGVYIVKVVDTKGGIHTSKVVKK